MVTPYKKVYNPIEDEMDMVNKVSWSIPVATTYNDLMTAINNSQLTPWTRYTFDYRTIHQIYGTTDLNFGSTEKLAVIALSPSTISRQAKSLDNNDDIIEYNYMMALAEDGVTPRPGFITYRKNMAEDIEARYDWRAVKNRRYWVASGSEWASGYYVIGNIVTYNDVIYSCNQDIDNPTLTPDMDQIHWIPVLSYHNNPYVLCTAMTIGGIPAPIDTWNYQDFMTFNGAKQGVSLGYNCKDIVFFWHATDIKLDQDATSCTFNGSVWTFTAGRQLRNFASDWSIYQIDLAIACSGITIANNSINIRIGNESNSIVIGTGCEWIRLLDTISWAFIGNDASYITLKDAWHAINIGQNNSNITIWEWCYNVILYEGNASVTIGDNSYNIQSRTDNAWITIGARNGGIVLMNQLDKVSLGDDNSSVTIQDSASWITIGKWNYVVLIGSGSSLVYIGDNNTQVNVETSTYNIYIGDNNNVSSVGWSCDNIKIGNNNNDVSANAGAEHMIVGNGNQYVVAWNDAINMVVGNLNNWIYIGNNCEQVLVGNSNRNINLYDGSHHITLGDSNQDVYTLVGAVIYISMKDNNSSIRFRKSNAYIKMGSSNSNLNFPEDSQKLTIPDVLSNIDFENNEIQTITPVDIPDGGTFKITFHSDTTNMMPFDATPAFIQATLEALGPIGLWNVIVTGDMLTQIKIMFTWSLASQPQSLVIVDSSLLTIGGSPLSNNPVIVEVYIGSASSTLLPFDFDKEIYKNQNGDYKIRYYDTGDVLATDILTA